MENTMSLDEQIKAAKALRAAGGAPVAGTKRRRLTPEERAQRMAEYEADKAARRAAREAKRANRLAGLAAARGTPHMKKVERAASILPVLDEGENGGFNALLVGFDIDSLEKIALHLDHFIRAERTKVALNTKLNVGQVVRIVGGTARFHGLVGTVAKVQRIRCYVNIPGMEKPQYFFCSDVKPLSTDDACGIDDAAAASNTGTEG
jgi:hypothetical protein